jgi:para-nitrobenzyl esterase
MIIRFTLFFSLLFSFSLFAQPEGCDGLRYRTAVFTDIEVTEGVKFGENTTIGGNFQELFMDVYAPANDEQELRPAVVLAFGGAFVTGNRQSLDGICRALARKGFVAATIDYRLFDLLLPTDSSQMTDVVVKAVTDMKAAIRFLREDAATDNEFGIDADFIFTGGISAGAIAAAHAAYLDETDVVDNDVQTAIDNNGGLDGNSSDNTEYSSAVQGVINYSGALKSANYISAGEPPLFSVHDDGDAIVPYENSFVPAGPIVVVYLEGSKSMHDRALSLDVNSELITIENSGGHVSYFQQNAAEYEALVDDATGNFLADIICGPLSSTEELASINSSLNLYPNPTVEQINLLFDREPGVYHVQVQDYAGRTIRQQQNMTGRQQQIALNNLPNGMYLLQIQFDDQSLAPIQRKVMVNR